MGNNNNFMENNNLNFSKYKINKKKIIKDLCNEININEEILMTNINKFEKYIKKTIQKKYENNSGLTDIKMNKFDYFILYILYINTKEKEYKLHILLLYIYSNCKLDGYDFNLEIFPFLLFFDFLEENKNIHSIFFELIRELK